MSIPQYRVRVADGSRVPQLTVKIAGAQTPAQCTMRVAEEGERAQFTVKIAEEGDRAAMTVILDGYAAGRNYQGDVQALLPVAYYVLSETSGTQAFDYSGSDYTGTYANAVPGGTEGMGDGNTAALFDGTGDSIDISAMLPDFDPDRGTILLWGKTSAWADSTTRFLVRIAADTDNLVTIGKGTATNELRLMRVAGGLAQTITSTALGGSGDFLSAALSWDRLGAGLKAFVNGAQVGTTRPSIGAFEETPVSAAIGAASSGGANSWAGGIAHVAIFDYALSDAEILSLGVL